MKRIKEISAEWLQIHYPKEDGVADERWGAVFHFADKIGTLLEQIFPCEYHNNRKNS